LVRATRSWKGQGPSPGVEWVALHLGIQNGERIHFHCLKPLNLWSFVIAAPGNEHQ
jgi:hypothetical protein